MKLPSPTKLFEEYYLAIETRGDSLVHTYHDSMLQPKKN
jgi:hypothetical protein